MSVLFDTHSHLNDERFDADRSDVVSRMVDSGVLYCNIIGADRASSESAVKLAQTRDGFFAIIGVHPQAADEFDSNTINWMCDLCQHPKVVAIGEIGLDYHYDAPSREIQRVAFETQFDWAIKWKLPVQLHIRDSHGEMMDFLRAHKSSSPNGIILHCFSGSLESAKVYLSLGCVISFSGSVTFKNAKNLQEVAKYVPLSSMLIETDCPYLAPEPMRGRRNEPAYVAHTASFIANLRNMSIEDFSNTVTQNALDVFRIKT